MLADGIKSIDRAQRTENGLGNEQRIARALILPAPLSEIGEVDVGSEEINLRRARSPYINQMRERARAWILPRQIARAYQRRVRVHRKGILGLASLGYLVGVARE